MKNILFLEKVFRCPSDKSPGGVELFNLSLLRDLTGMGYKVTVPAHRSWAPLINDATADSASSPEIVTLPGNLNKMIGNLATLWRLASGWYAGRLERGYARREPSAAADYLRSAGLSGAFWGLPD